MASPSADGTDTRRRWLRRAVVGLIALLLCGAALAGVGAWAFFRAVYEWHRPPDSPVGLQRVEARSLRGSAVVTAHPLASEAGREMLVAGGSAVDAAVAVQLVLSQVEPHWSGIGGGAFLLYWDAQRQQLFAHDGRERAPLAADSTYLSRVDGSPMRFDRAMIGGRSVGTPGVLRMLEDAHRAHGRLPWRRTFDPALRLARRGFRVTPHLHHMLRHDPVAPTMPSLRAHYFQADGSPLPTGARLRDPAYAQTLSRVAKRGADGFYTGPVARSLVRHVAQAVQPSTLQLLSNVVWIGLGLHGDGVARQPAPGALTLEDLANYRSVEREPLCRIYRSYRVCGFGPPSGGIMVLQILGLLERFDMAALEPRSARAYHLVAEAQRLAYLDRDRWVGDPDHVAVPTEGLLDDDYLRERAAVLDEGRSFVDDHPAGTPPGAESAFVPGPSRDGGGTTHFSILDRFGNAVSMTSSIEGPFGAHLRAEGVLLNNELTDFSFVAESEGRPVANAPGPGKRPRSSMSPLLIFDAASGELRFVLGSPGGNRIIAYVAQAAVALMDWKLSPQEAVELPHVVARSPEVEIEATGWHSADERAELLEALESLGHDVVPSRLASGLHVIEVAGDELRTGVDPRREGLALSADAPSAP